MIINGRQIEIDHHFLTSCIHFHYLHKYPDQRDILVKYTERQKKHHFFKLTHIKIQSIKMNHNWAQISKNTPYQAHKKKLCLLESKKNKIYKVKSQEVMFQKSQKLLASPGTELGTDNSQYGGYNNPPLKLNEQLLKCSEQAAFRGGSQRAVSVIFEK